MFMLFYKHLNELYRSYSKSLRDFGSSPVQMVKMDFSLKSIFMNYPIHSKTELQKINRFVVDLTWTNRVIFTVNFICLHVILISFMNSLDF